VIDAPIQRDDAQEQGMAVKEDLSDTRDMGAESESYDKRRLKGSASTRVQKARRRKHTDPPASVV
jgi:hypothetical protein